jgi:hypothetical protein
MQSSWLAYLKNIYRSFRRLSRSEASRWLIPALSTESSQGVFAKVPINLLFAHLIITFQFGNQCNHAPTFNKPRKPKFIPNLLQFHFLWLFSEQLCFTCKTVPTLFAAMMDHGLNLDFDKYFSFLSFFFYFIKKKTLQNEISFRVEMWACKGSEIYIYIWKGSILI